MKKLLLPLIAGCAALLSTMPANAAGPKEKTYGGYAPGKTFTMKVIERTSVRTRGDNADRNVRVPSRWPDFKEGQKVEFVIGGKGELTGPGFSINYKTEEGRVNLYANNPTFSSPKGMAALVYKSRKGSPRVVTMTFYKLRFSGFTPITNTVTYRFER